MRKKTEKRRKKTIIFPLTMAEKAESLSLEYTRAT